jgi:integrase
LDEDGFPVGEDGCRAATATAELRHFAFFSDDFLYFHDFVIFWFAWHRTNNSGSNAREAGMFDRSGNRKYLNGQERKAFRHAVAAEKNLPRKAFLLTLFYTGCRISEALNVPVGRIDLMNRAITFETLKRRRPGCFRSVPVPDSLAEILRNLVAGKGDSERLWKFSRSTAYRMVRAKMRRAHVAGAMACPKGLRHGHGVACVAVKIPLTTIQKWLGHARLETTAIYLDVLGEEERALAKRLW